MGDSRKLIIIGSGPAGYTAGIYAARAELAPLIFAGEKWGGQLMSTTVVENWPGTEQGVMGPELMDGMRKQATKFGAEIVDKNVTKVDFSGMPFKVWQGEVEFKVDAVIVATGAEAMMLNVPGEEWLLGRGIATCAVCDAAFYKEKIAAVVGGGDAAIEDTLALTKFASKVYLLVRRDELRASKILARRVTDNPKVEVRWNTEVREAVGETKLEKLKIVDNKSNQESELIVDGLFYAVGHKPVTEIFRDKLTLDEKGFLVTGISYPSNSKFQILNSKSFFLGGYPTMTSVPGVFGAGDVVDFRYKQAITAAGMGCQAALDAERWLESKE